ncbi:vWA domain-containing protein [Cytobacillus sp. Hm23]
MRKILVLFVCMLILTSCGGKEDSGAAENKETTTESSFSYDQAAPDSKETSLPNGATYDDMYFEHYGTNPFVSTEDDSLSTFAIDVDTGSYSVVRNYLSRGTMPPNDAVRVEEFVNYFDSNITPPENETFSIRVDGSNSPFGEGYKLMRVDIKGREINVDDRKPAHLTFVIDVSGSMEQEGRLELVKKSLHLLLSQLKPEDKVSIVTYGSHARVVLRPSSLDNITDIERAINELGPEGSTNVEDGLKMAYEMARENFHPGAVNRVILCSDGVANVGETSADGILEQIKSYAKKDITLSTFGFGMGNYNDVLMEQLADRGDGNYAYIDTFSEARRIFMEELTGTIYTIAKDMKVQVEFNPETVDRYRLIGYENRDVDDEDFRNDTVDGGEIGAGHTVTALYELKLKTENPNNIGDVHLRFTDVELNEINEITKPLSITGDAGTDFNFIAAVAEFAEILRGSYWAKEGTFNHVLEVAERNANTEKEFEFVHMVKDAIGIEAGEK